MRPTLSVIIPCYNEEATLEKCVDRVRELATQELSIEVIIVDDCSRDRSREIAQRVAARHGDVRLLTHDANQGKGAALHTGIAGATGDFVAIQDADLEYDPKDLLRLIVPLIDNEADVVIGSRFASHGAHRVLYFWHSLGNKLLTFLSNMFTDLNLTDMESCYKVFRRELIQSLELHEKRFGFEPEVVAAVAERRVRIVEMGISYYGRTYEEGKKIGFRDGLRAFYCIVRYNAHNLPAPIQFLAYVAIGGVCAVVNLIVFLLLLRTNLDAGVSAPIAFVAAAAFNYWLCVKLIFRHQVRWNRWTELAVYAAAVLAICVLDRYVTLALMPFIRPMAAKSVAAAIVLLLNFAARRLVVFPEKPRGPWRPQESGPLSNLD